MINIITVTTSWANNMGALLQCYALSQYLNNLPDVKCEVMNYYPPGWTSSWNIIHSPKSFRDIIKMIYLSLRPDKIISKRKKNKVMRRFISKYIPLTEEKYYNKSINKNCPVADIFICGSDQIWNLKLFDEPILFLDFCKHNPQCKRISYAASITETWTEEGCKHILPWLKKFNKISIREIGNLEQVNSLVPEKKPTVVCDPVFLLDKKEWDLLAKTPQLDEPYIFCYFLSVSDLAVKTVDKIRKLTGYKVVHLNLNARDKFNSDIDITVGDPCDFIGLIKGATIICTNSFHCSAFSVVYQKNFVIIPNARRNERLHNIQEHFRLDVMITPEKLSHLTIDDLVVDYTEGQVTGNSYINHSKQFLHDAIYGE